MSLIDIARSMKHRVFPAPQVVPESIRALEEWSAFNRELDHELTWSEVTRTKSDPNELYRYLHHYFHHRAPKCVTEHRKYFSQEQRGFGEDAFHSMWWLLFQEHRPVNCLEIGVYRGQVLSLWTLLAKVLHIPCKTLGISPLSRAGDVVSGGYLESIDYEADIRSHFDYFGLPSPSLLKAFSTDDAAKEAIAETTWDLIYIDGNHDFDIVVKDFELCREHLASGGLLVLDDAGCEFDYTPPPFAFAGHPGPSRVAVGMASRDLSLIAVAGHNVVFQKGMKQA